MRKSFKIQNMLLSYMNLKRYPITIFMALTKEGALAISSDIDLSGSISRIYTIILGLFWKSRRKLLFGYLK